MPGDTDPPTGDNVYVLPARFGGRTRSTSTEVDTPPDASDPTFFFDAANPKWFVNPQYRPKPEYDVIAGDYCFRYKPEFEDFFMARAQATGESLVAISAELGIPFVIVKHWAKRIRSFAVALEMAHQCSQVYWENTGEVNLVASNKEFNAGAWLKMMAIRYPDHWRDIEESARVTKDADPFGFKAEDEVVDAKEVMSEIMQRLSRIRETG